VPQLVRGYGHVKEAAARKAAAERQRLVDRLEAPAGEPELQAAE
jgi:indolepyruvate ferredoxin oxidoreductase